MKMNEVIREIFFDVSFITRDGVEHCHVVKVSNAKEARKIIRNKLTAHFGPEVTPTWRITKTSGPYDKNGMI